MSSDRSGPHIPDDNCRLEPSGWGPFSGTQLGGLLFLKLFVYLVTVSSPGSLCYSPILILRQTIGSFLSALQR